jgi:membrane-associated protease RseP (regulator of RpoE activity)
MVVDFLSGLAQFAIANKLIVGFYIGIFLLIAVFRKKFQFQLKVIAILRTNMGLSLMDRIANRHRELIKLLGYIGVGAGFLSMLAIIFILLQSVYTLLTVSNAVSPISPVLPGVRIPGVASEFFVPFVQGVIAIFIIAVVHEFAHGVVARAHDIKVKSSGPAVIGPLFAAFVELDDKQAAKKDDIVNYSIFAAGTFSNILLAILIMLTLSFIFAPINSNFFQEEGIRLIDVTEGTPAAAAGLTPDMEIKYIDGQEINSVVDAVSVLQFTRPNELVTFNDGTNDFAVTSGQNENFPKRGFFGIVMAPVIHNSQTVYYKVFSWIQGLLALTATLSLGIGLANMIPIGPIDGGKMLHLAMKRIKGETKANKTFVGFSILMLIVILFLLSPILKAVLGSIL